MNRIIYLLLAIMLLIPMLYVIFFTPFIPLLLRQMKIGRSTSDVKSLVDDAEQAITNRVRDLEAQRNAADEELSDVSPIKIVRGGSKSEVKPELEILETEVVDTPIVKSSRTKKTTKPNTPTE